jgi:hypothetical protein
MIARLLHLAPPVIERLRLTIPAREAIERASAENRILLAGEIGGMAAPLYSVELVRPPVPALVLAHVGRGVGEQSNALRCADEPAWPGEWPEGEAVSCWDRGDWVPCPTCGYSLLWCEAGFVPGWRVCLAGHACQLSDDGRSAERHPKQDGATLRATRPIR